MLYFAYDNLTVDNGSLYFGPHPNPHEPYVFYYWIPSMALVNHRRFQLTSIDDVLRRDVPFVYPLELRHEFINWFERHLDVCGRLPQFVPKSVLEAVRRGKAIILLSFMHEARLMKFRRREGRSAGHVYHLIDRFAKVHDLPDHGVWFLNGNLIGKIELEQWCRAEGVAVPPFQVRCCENLSYMAKYLLRLNLLGMDLQVDWRVEKLAIGLKHKSTRLTMVPLERDVKDVYLFPEMLRQELASSNVRPKLYLCMNRVPRASRRNIVCNLAHRGFLSRGWVSFQDSDADKVTFSDSGLQQAWESLRSSLPLLIDRDLSLETAAYTQDNFNTTKMETNWPFTETYFNIVNETLFTPELLQITEKVYKPILNCQPFVVTGTPHILARLKAMGFKTFSKIIDESYDDEVDNNLRMQKVLSVINQICTLNQSRAREMMISIVDVLEHNFRHLQSMVTPLEQIMDEVQDYLEI